MSEQFRLQLLFNKYLQRNCSPQELEELLGLLNRADSADILDSRMRGLWELAQNNYDEEAEPDWQAMYTHIISANTTTSLPATPKRKTKWWRLAAAAAILLPVMIGSRLFFGKQNIAEVNQPVNKPTAKVQLKPVSHQTIHLPDGSTVVLNAGSRLNYPPVFNTQTRIVYLSGEGFFDIKHNPKQPFIVHAGNIAVKVLGTAFNIKTSGANQKVEVTVTRGKVQVLADEKPIGFVSASQQLAYAPITGTVNRSVVDTLPVLAWKPAELFFNDISMEEFAQSLQKRFAITVQFENAAIKACRFTGTFSEEDMPEEMLAVACAISRSSFTIHDKTIIIHGKGCQ